MWPVVCQEAGLDFKATADVFEPRFNLQLYSPTNLEAKQVGLLH